MLQLQPTREEGTGGTGFLYLCKKPTVLFLEDVDFTHVAKGELYTKQTVEIPVISGH
jgi:hypothetical protein